MPTILYVDDEPSLRRAVRAWLARQGTVVHSAAGIASARECLDEHEFDGAFIDLWLADGSGFELYDWIVEHHPALAARIAFVTGDVLRGEATQAQLGMLGCPVLPKPFDLTELDDYVAHWTRDGEAGAVPRSSTGAASQPPL